MKEWYVYILANNAQVLYIGVTSSLELRYFQHTRDRKKALIRELILRSG
jgi:predicted GIY-YIG superfamily endonuclease